MSYRNAFAHGEASTDGRIIKLKYYEGQPRKVTLDEKFFSDFERTLNKCYQLTERIVRKMILFKTGYL